MKALIWKEGHENLKWATSAALVLGGVMFLGRASLMSPGLLLFLSPIAAASTAPSPGQDAASPIAPASVAAPPSAASVAASEEARVEVHGPTLDLAFTNRGARIFSWRLPLFKDAEGGPVEMVQAIKDGPRPLDLATGDAALDARLANALFQASQKETELPPGGAKEVKRMRIRIYAPERLLLVLAHNAAEARARSIDKH